MKKTNKIEFIERHKFHIIAETCRIYSYSIMNDNEMLKQYNSIDQSTKNEIIKVVKEIDKKYKNINDLTDDERFSLRVVDIHIISGRHNIDPAVALMTLSLTNNKKVILK